MTSGLSASHAADLLADLEPLVRCESPSADVAALHRCADLVADLGAARLGAPAVRDEAGGKPVLRFGPADAPVLLLAHLDTVHPVGTLDRVPYQLADSRITGPGVFDMKAGLVMALHALAARPEAAALLVTSDEEIGSPDSRAVIEAAARGASAVLVLEASSGGRLKTARKGVSNYVLELRGRAAHAGLEPEKGANACMALAHVVLGTAALADPAAGTTVTPTVASAGTTANTVPDRAELALDVRAATAAEQQRVDDGLRALGTGVDDVALVVHGGINRPPLPTTASDRLFGLAQRAAAELGLGPIEGEQVGGGSDGNFTAALGVDTLDGLGAVGAGAHTEHEWADASALAERTALLIRLIDLITEPEPTQALPAEGDRL
jgi:glutamate carboxypeptidase